MDIQQLIENYGYVAVVIGTFLEGETVVILAGFAAHRGYLDLSLVMTAAFAGTFVGDQLYFYLGRRHAALLMRLHPRWEPRIVRVLQLVRRYRVLIILGFRFIYGIRTVTPFALGMGKVPSRIFVPLNLLGALVWSAAVSFAGYLFGEAMTIFLGNLRHYEVIILLGMALAGLVVWLIYLWRVNRGK
jgi:membrane protein DedA with SNARE-associated domain